MRVLGHADGITPVGLDLLSSPCTTAVGSVTDREFVQRWMAGVDVVLHTATLHKPHVGSNARQEFVDTNVTGTLTLLEGALAAGVGSFVFTSSTTTFGHALTRPAGAPAAWITEDVAAAPKNIYGVTKTAAEDRCELFHRDHGLPCLDRVYVNDRARAMLAWEPRYDFRFALDRLAAGEDPRSPLTLAVGAKGYHAESFGVYTIRGCQADRRDRRRRALRGRGGACAPGRGRPDPGLLGPQRPPSSRPGRQPPATTAPFTGSRSPRSPWGTSRRGAISRGRNPRARLQRRRFAASSGSSFAMCSGCCAFAPRMNQIPWQSGRGHRHRIWQPP